MREFSSSIREGLFNGLKPKNSAEGASYLSQCFNLIGYSTYFGSYKPVEDRLVITKEYPFPQWIKLHDYELIITKDDVRQLVGDNLVPFTKGNWNATEFTKPFYGVSYGAQFVLLNSNGCVYFDGTELHKTTSLKANVLVEHRNRSIIGGVIGDLWSSEWKDFFNGYTSAEINHDLDIRGNAIFWSSFGSTDFPLALLEPYSMLSDSESLQDMFRHNEWGFLELGFMGNVLDIVEFRDNLVVAGEYGIWFVSQDIELPGAGYGRREHIQVGLKCRGSIHGDNVEMLFIDQHNHLWHFTRDTRNIFDYSDYFKDLEEPMFIKKDSSTGFYYIGDENNSYLFTGRGLYKVFQTIGSLDESVGITFVTGSDEAIIESDIHDIFNHSQKTIVGVGIVANTNLIGTISANADVRGTQVQGPELPINHENYSAVRLFGKNHKIKISLESYENKNIRAIELKWQSDDARYRRGVSGLENAGTAGSGEVE